MAWTKLKWILPALLGTVVIAIIAVLAIRDSGGDDVSTTTPTATGTQTATTPTGARTATTPTGATDQSGADGAGGSLEPRSPSEAPTGGTDAEGALPGDSDTATAAVPADEPEATTGVHISSAGLNPVQTTPNGPFTVYAYIEGDAVSVDAMFSGLTFEGASRLSYAFTDEEGRDYWRADLSAPRENGDYSFEIVATGTGGSTDTRNVGILRVRAIPL